jgi:hypothetical protein
VAECSIIRGRRVELAPLEPEELDVVIRARIAVL